jgi:hypothetical protein
MESRVTLVKLRFYSRLCRLDDSRLVKIVFRDRQAHMKRYLEEHGTLLGAEESITLFKPLIFYLTGRTARTSPLENGIRSASTRFAH